MAKPILGAQPPPPGILPIRYVDVEYQEPSIKLVSAPPYYQKPISKWYEPQDEIVDLSGQSNVSYISETNSMMLVRLMQSRVP